MSDFKLRLDQMLHEKIDRRTFLTRAGLLILVALGAARFLNLGDLAFGEKKKAAEVKAPATAAAPVQDASHHARAMAVSSMRV